jgi:hypothetical protein
MANPPAWYMVRSLAVQFVLASHLRPTLLELPRACTPASPHSSLK